MANQASTYQRPTLTRIGSFEDITQGNSTGSNFDSNFIVGQPIPADGQFRGDPTS